MIQLKTSEELDHIGRGGAIIAGLFEQLSERIAPGVSTGQIDQWVGTYIGSFEGATPAFFGLYGFPGKACISVNEEVVHGIPSTSRVLAEGDIVSVDVGVKLDGWCSDSAWTFPVGRVDEATRALLDVTEASLNAAIEATQAGGHVGDLGAAVMATVKGTGHSIIRDLVGHGIGREVHEDPQVPNTGISGQGPPLRPGTVLAIEPMISIGSDQIRTLKDRWTVVTTDRSRAAHFEHTVAVTEDGPRILTLQPATAGSDT